MRFRDAKKLHNRDQVEVCIITRIQDRHDDSLLVTVSNLSIPGWPDYECEVSRTGLGLCGTEK